MNSKTFFDLILPAAREAGAYQKSKWNTAVNIEFKGHINLVTEVDKKCEEMIVGRIQKKYPDHDFLAEEGGGARKDSPYKWIIDPLDGTTNFAHGYPLFCASIGLEFENKILAGVVYDPLHDEMFSAYRGEGAFLNQKKIHVSSREPLNDALMATGFAYNVREVKDNNLNHFKNFIMKARAVRRDGVAAIDLCYLACGRYDGFWELGLYPWDTTAGLIVATEAGGKVSRFDGSPYTVYEKDILATNGKIHEEAIETLKLP